MAEKRPPTFKEAVRAAYLAEHGLTQDQQIAAMLGIEKSALSLRLKNARLGRSDKLMDLLGPISSRALRQAVLIALEGEVFGTGAAPSARPAQRAGNLAAANRPELALAVALEGLDGEADDKERWMLLLQATSLCFRVDAPGEAMGVAARMREWGEASSRPELVAAGHAVAARAMRRAGFPPEEAQAERDRATRYLGMAKVADPRDRAAAFFARDTVESEQIEAVLRVHETRGGQEEALRKGLASIAARRAAGALTKAGVARAMQLEAKLRLGLGELAAAEAALDAAEEAGGNGPRAWIACAPIRARLLAARGETREAVELLRRLAATCERDRHEAMFRVAQYELARLARPGGAAT